ncbi:MAG: DUF5011 domain-containing protein [Eubacterium sp.]|nr:DUF5011 domain-containing protein [Eubacterium sp.]
MKRAITILLILTTFATGALCVLSKMRRDTKAPVISVPTEMITYEEGSDKALLLAGVTASDDRDGDVTANVRIYDIAVMEDGHSAQVIYAAYDSSYNLGKRFRTVGYKPARKNVDMTDEMYDIISDDIVVANKSTTEVTTEATTQATTEEEITSFPYIKLVGDGAIMNVGDNFDPMAAIEDVKDDVDDRDSLFNRIDLEGEYDMSQAGTYELIYSVRDSEGNRSKEVKFTLIVRE